MHWHCTYLRVLLFALLALPACRIHLVDIFTPYAGVEQRNGRTEVNKGALWDGYPFNNDIVARCAVVCCRCDPLVARADGKRCLLPAKHTWGVNSHGLLCEALEIRQPVQLRERGLGGN